MGGHLRSIREYILKVTVGRDDASGLAVDLHHKGSKVCEECLFNKPYFGISGAPVSDSLAGQTSASSDAVTLTVGVGNIQQWEFPKQRS